MMKERLNPVEDDGDLEPLRISDLVDFFSDRKRSLSCPYCTHKGGWEIALHTLVVEDDKDPLLVIFPNKSVNGTSHNSCGLTCPNCGHFTFVSTYKIRQYLKESGRENG